MNFFSYEVLHDDKHVRKLTISSDIEKGTAEIDKENHLIIFHNFDKSFRRVLHKDFVEKFLWASLKNFPERKHAGFGPG